MPVMDDVRWIGREGEKRFSLLCSRRMVTCNKADEDDRGWDFLIHFPPPAIVRIPIDQRSTGCAALVQIKATRVDARRWSITLKNALSLARSPLPAFIVCVGLDAEGGETFRAVHIWQTDIGRILKAARQAHFEGDEATNRRSISFDLGADATRADVLGWMSGEIDAIGESEYAAAKQMLLDTLGFEEGRGTARVTFSTASLEDFADLQLGIRKSLDIDRFSYASSRFGIESPTAEIDVGRGTLELIPRGRKGTLRLRSSGGQQEFLSAEVFSAALPGRRRTKGRISAGCLDVIVRPKGRFSVKCSLDYNEVTTLANIATFALVRQSRRDTPLAVGLRTNASFVEFGQINMTVDGAPGWEHLFFMTEALRTLVAFENAQPLVTSVNAMNSQFVPLSVLDALVANRPLRMEFTPIEEVDGTVGAFLAYTSVAFGGIEIGAVASRPVVEDTMLGSRRSITFGPATVLHASVDDGCAGDMYDRYVDELDRLSETCDVLAVGDLQRCIAGDDDRVLVIDAPRHAPRRRQTLVHPRKEVHGRRSLCEPAR